MAIALARSNHLVDEINRVLLSAPQYVSVDDFWFRRMLGEAEKLKDSARHAAHNILAQLYGLAGDAALAEQHISAALHLKFDYAYLCNRAAILSNLGYFSRSQKS